MFIINFKVICVHLPGFYEAASTHTLFQLSDRNPLSLVFKIGDTKYVAQEIIPSAHFINVYKSQKDVESISPMYSSTK